MNITDKIKRIKESRLKPHEVYLKNMYSYLEIYKSPTDDNLIYYKLDEYDILMMKIKSTDTIYYAPEIYNVLRYTFELEDSVSIEIINFFVKNFIDDYTTLVKSTNILFNNIKGRTDLIKYEK